MDGKTLLEGTRFLLNEESGSGFLNDKETYMFIRQAAEEFVRRTQYLKSKQTITTVADQTDYTLNADYMNLYARDNNGSYFILYNDGNATQSIFAKDYEEVLSLNDTTSITTPTSFSIINDNVIDNQVTGTTTSDGASSGGLAILTDTTADFSDVSVGDIVHNTTDTSEGYVTSKTSSTVLVVALFNGTANDWTSGDAYVIQPQSRYKMVLNPPPSTAGHTITLHYIQRPAPVFSDYGVYPLPQQASSILTKYASWLYKYRDSEPSMGDAWYQYFDRECRQMGNVLYTSMHRNEFKVNMKANKTNRSFR